MENLIIVTFFLITSSVKSQDKFFIPKSYEIQYAGNVGMISLSPIWKINKVLTIQLGLGYTPKFKAD